ncbi:PQQ-binding-like beta-propeller repeat protein, partial [Candidatus Woesearchaeota archaeon]|nr:PQQ-binding-like beta-propeller repeat protein [Candidatus Woesearchaeota archaeon]
MDQKEVRKISAVMLMLVISSLIVLTLAAGQQDSDPTTTSQWPNFRRNINRTGYYPGNVSLDNFGVLWRFPTKEPVWNSIALQGGMGYFADRNGSLFAVNITNGRQVWNYTILYDFRVCSPMYYDGNIYIAGLDNHTHQVDASTGAQVWNFSMSSKGTSSPLVFNNTLYTAEYNGTVYAVNASNISQPAYWTYDMKSEIDSSPAYWDGKIFIGSWDGNLTAFSAADGSVAWWHMFGDQVRATPSLAGGWLYISTNDGNISRLNATDGSVDWTTNASYSIHSSPAYAFDRIFVGSWQNQLHTLNATTGSVLWNLSVGGNIRGSPAITQNRIGFIGSADGYIRAFDFEGNVLWKHQIGISVQSSPQIVDGKVFIGSGEPTDPKGIVFGFGPRPNISSKTRDEDEWRMFKAYPNSTGRYIGSEFGDNGSLELAWSWNSTGIIWSSPAVAEGIVFVGSRSNNLTALNTTTGKPVWTYNTTNDIDSSPAISDGIVYFGADDHYFNALNSSDGTVIWQYRTGGPVDEASPAVVGGVVYIGSDGMYALNAKTGGLIWNYTYDNADIRSGVAYADQRIYFSDVITDSAYCVNATNGTKIWNLSIGTDISSTPAVSGGQVYIGGYNWLLYSLDAYDGSVTWTYNASGQIKTSPVLADDPIIGSEVVYFGGGSFNITAVKTSDGSHVWSYETGNVITSTPIYADGKIFLASGDGYFRILNASDGTHIWNYSIGPSASSPAMIKDKLFLGGNNNLLYAFQKHACMYPRTGDWLLEDDDYVVCTGYPNITIYGDIGINGNASLYINNSNLTLGNKTGYQPQKSMQITGQGRFKSLDSKVYLVDMDLQDNASVNYTRSELRKYTSPGTVKDFSVSDYSMMDFIDTNITAVFRLEFELGDMSVNTFRNTTFQDFAFTYAHGNSTNTYHNCRIDELISMRDSSRNTFYNTSFNARSNYQPGISCFGETYTQFHNCTTKKRIISLYGNSTVLFNLSRFDGRYFRAFEETNTTLLESTISDPFRIELTEDQEYNVSGLNAGHMGDAQIYS